MATYGPGRVTALNVGGQSGTVGITYERNDLGKNIATNLASINAYRTEEQNSGAQTGYTPITVHRPPPQPSELPRQVSNTLHDRERIVETLATWADQSDAVIAAYRRNMQEWTSAQRQSCQNIREARNLQIRTLQAKNEEMVASYEQCIALVQTQAENWIAEKEAVVSDARHTMYILRGESPWPQSAPPATDPPEHLCCPITLQVMNDPVVASDGQTYERSAIEAVLRQRNPRSPMTNEPFTSTVVFPNVRQRAMSRSWYEENRL